MARSGPVIVAEDPALLTAVTYTEFTITQGSSTSNPGSTGTTLIRTNQVQSDSDIPGTTSITTTSNNQTYTTTINEIEEQNFINNVYNTSTGGVGSLNAQTGDLTLAAGSNVSVITSGSTITISAAGGLGSSGYSGYSGAAGSPGSTGVSGVSGYSGAPGAGTPAGDDTEIQYNNSGTFGASAALTWNNASGRLSVEGTEEVGPIHENFTQNAPAQLTITITFIGPPVNAYSTNVTIVSGGSGFTNGQQIFIPGTNLGGVSPTNDRTLTITGTGGGGSIVSTSIDSDPAPVVGTYNFNPVSASVTTNIYYLSTGVSSFNVNSINLAQDFCTNFLLVITQGATPLVPNSFSIDGTNVPLLYPGGTLITGTASSTDVVNISVFRTGASAYTALAQVVSFS